MKIELDDKSLTFYYGFGFIYQKIIKMKRLFKTQLLIFTN